MSEHAADSMSPVYELYQEGCRLLDDGDPAGAIAPLERAVALEPETASLHEALARACFATSRIRRARREFERALALEPSNAYIHYGLGRTYERQGRLMLAGKHFKLASALSPQPTYRQAAERIARRTG
ncbi:MAG TPA: tetratricopeptide repeat protein [Euzebyales bacterium]|nr:tetratricopeptide repeat protein [Euzebyales bacterium]